MIGVTLRSFLARRALELQSLFSPPKYSLHLLPPEDAEVLTVEEGGKHYPVFVLGIHNPDDASVERWVP